MSAVDYSAPAQVFGRPRGRAKGGLFYRRFASVADALQFVIEDAPDGLTSILIETDDARFEGAELRAMYDAAEFPLPRSGAVPS